MGAAFAHLWEVAGPLWTAAGAAGGSLALAFIVLLALGLAALTAMFVGAAVVVLERFARQARRPSSLLPVGALWVLATALVGIDYFEPGALADRHELARTLPPALAVAGLVVAVALAATWLLLRFVSPRALGIVALAVIAAGVFLAVPLPPLAWRGLATRELAGQLGFALLAGLAGFVMLGLAPLGAAGLVDARGSAEWFIAVRYLVAKRRQTFISVITSICVAGVAAGVWLIITVLSVMNGFQTTWRDQIIGHRAHFTVQSGLGPFGDYESVLQRVLDTPGVAGASPFVQAEGMVRGEGGEIVGVGLQGIDPRRIGDVTDLRRNLIEGSLDGLLPAADGKRERSDPGVVIGDRLAALLGLHVGDTLLVVSPFGGPPTPMGPAPRLSRFKVAAIFRATAFQDEEKFIYVSLPAAQDFRRSGDVVDGIEVRTSDLYRSVQIGEQVVQQLGFPFFSRDWKEFFPAFFQALKTERIMMFVLLTMIMVVAAFAIVVTLVMMIMEKSGDIAILKAMGARDAAIERIFAIEGALIGLVGTAIGLVAGVAVTTRLDWIQKQVEAVTGIDALPASVYQGISQLPAELDVVQIAVVVAIAMSLALGGTLIPSRQGARLDPVEALRYE